MAKRKDKSIKCPYCGSVNIESHGIRENKNISPARRYNCHDCGKYFSTKISLSNLRVVVISDLHCGHRTGLTHPDWNTGKDKFYDFRKESWKWYESMMQRLKPIDILIVNGDCVDGRQEKNGGQELVEGSRINQSKMAVDVITVADAKKIYITRGTPYHTGKEENIEDGIVDKLNDLGNDASIFNYLKLDVNGCIFDVRHKTGRSNIPHGRFTQMARTSMWNDLMNKTDKKANVIIRSHVHYFTALMHSNNRLAITTPALQGDSDYGQKECEGSIDYGFVKFDISKEGLIDDWKCYTAKFSTDLNPIEVCKIK